MLDGLVAQHHRTDDCAVTTGSTWDEHERCEQLKAACRKQESGLW